MSTQRAVVNQMVAKFGHGPDALADGKISAVERASLYEEAGKLFRQAHELVGVAVLVYGDSGARSVE